MTKIELNAEEILKCREQAIKDAKSVLKQESIEITYESVASIIKQADIFLNTHKELNLDYSDLEVVREDGYDGDHNYYFEYYGTTDVEPVFEILCKRALQIKEKDFKEYNRYKKMFETE